MEILLVEDDEHKRRALGGFIAEMFPRAAVREANSLSSASAEIQERDYHLIVLDMSLPTYDVTTREAGGRPQGFGGVEIMMLLEALGRKAKVILVSQFPEFGEGDESTDLKSLGDRLMVDYTNNFMGWVFYEQSSDRWKSDVKRLLSPLQEQS